MEVRDSLLADQVLELVGDLARVVAALRVVGGLGSAPCGEVDLGAGFLHATEVQSGLVQLILAPVAVVVHAHKPGV